MYIVRIYFKFSYVRFTIALSEHYLLADNTKHLPLLY